MKRIYIVRVILAGFLLTLCISVIYGIQEINHRFKNYNSQIDTLKEVLRILDESKVETTALIINLEREVKNVSASFESLRLGIPNCSQPDYRAINIKTHPAIPWFLTTGEYINIDLSGGTNGGIFFDSGLPIGLILSQDGILQGAPEKASELSEYKIFKLEIRRCLQEMRLFVGVVENETWDPALHSEYELVEVFSGRGTSEGLFRIPYGSEITEFEGSKEVLVTDCVNNGVYRFSNNGQYVGKFGEGFGTKLGFFNTPADIKKDKNNRILVVEERNHRVQVFDVNHKPLFSFGSFGIAGGDQRQDLGFFNNPLGIAISSQNLIYVSDTGNSRIQVFDDNGEFLKTFGEKGYDPGFLLEPYYLEFDSEDSLYVVDRGAHRVQKFDRDGNFLEMWGGKDGNGYPLKSRNKSEFNRPHEIAIDKLDNFYVADTFNNRVQGFNKKGEFLFELGNDQVIPGPKTIAVDREGSLYIGINSKNTFMTKWVLRPSKIDVPLYVPKEEKIWSKGDASSNLVYYRYCKQCHSNKIASTPQFGDREAWNMLSAKGIDYLYGSVAKGKSLMPPNGGCEECSASEIIQAIEYLINSGK